MSHLKRAIIKASEHGQADSIAALLDFVLRHDVKPSNIIGYDAIKIPIRNGHANLIKARAPVRKTVINTHFGHNGRTPLGYAVGQSQVEIVAVLLELGAKAKLLE
jgi:ankyrin repeat protein